MKKILFLTPYVPSNRAGGENFTRLLLQTLSEHNKIDLIYFKYKDDPYYELPNKNVRILKVIENSILVKLKNFILYPWVHPVFSIRFDRRILQLVQQLILQNNYDLLYLDHSQMGLYGKYFPRINKILMSHDVMAQRYYRKGNGIIRRMVLKGEKKLMTFPNTTVFSFSDKDKKIIRDTYNIDSRVTNFILEDLVINARPDNICKRIVFMGKWKRADNYDGLKWFFDNCYNKIDKNIEIDIIGKWLPDDFANILNTLPNVKYLGFVENPYILIANSIAVISPLFSGAGVKVKVVESLACGTPVVGNDIAFEGISNDFEEFMIKAVAPKDYVDIINNISISLEKRQMFKDMFMKNYQLQSICSFIGAL